MKPDKKSFVYNTWQLYAAAEDFYKSQKSQEIKKVKHLHFKLNIYKFTGYQIDNDVMLVARNYDRLHFMFIGSDDIKDWINNFDCNLNNDGIHDGFANSANKFYQAISKEINKFEKKFNKQPVINFIGHSRGGALALLAAKHTNEMYNCLDIRLSTFGQPRVGNHLFNIEFSKLNIYYVRTIFSNDPVCEIPPIELGYEHPWCADVVVLPEAWWHRFHIMGKRVHLNYNKTISNKLYKDIQRDDR